MKTIKIIIALYILHCTLYIAPAQVRQDRSIIRGNVTSITVKYPGDITVDSLFFQVRTNSSYTSTKHIEKENTVAGGSDAEILATYAYPYTTIKVFFSTANTSGLTIANYYYDLRKSVSPDSAVLVYGTFKIQSYAGENVNNLAGTGGGLSESSVKSWIGDTADVIRLELADYTLDTDLTDSLDNIRTLIGTSGIPLPDSVIYTSELTPYVDKSSTQTITGQKNFTGIVKFRADTGIVIGGNEVRTGYPVAFDYVRPETYYDLCNSDLFTTRVFGAGQDTVSDWTMNFRTWDFNNVRGHGMYFGLNENGRRPNEPQFSFVAEAPYRWLDTSEVYEWYWHWSNKYTAPDYSYRPLGLAVYYYRDSITNLQLSTPPQVILHPAFNEIQFHDRDNNYIGRMYFNGSGNSFMEMADTFYIANAINNVPFFYQANNIGNNVELIRVDGDNNVSVAPNGNPIELAGGISGSIFWWDSDTTNRVGITIDSDNKLSVGGTEGLYTQQLSVGFIPTDTTGLLSGQIVADPNSGVLSYLLPQNIVLNGDFTDWTGDDPDDWISSVEDAGNYVEESPVGSLHFVTDGTLHAWTLYQNGILDSGTVYGYAIKIDSCSANDTLIVGLGGAFNINITTAGVYTGTFTAEGTNYANIGMRNQDNNISYYVDYFHIWVKDGAAKQPIYKPHQTPITINGVTVTDTVFIGRMEQGAVFDSIRVFDVQDSIAIQLFYRNPTDNDLITSVDTLTTDTTITFDTTTIPVGAKVYMYPVYIGDSEAYLRTEIYWRN